MDRAEIKLASGDAIKVEGTLDEIEKKLSDASRSGQSPLAWFTEVDSGAPVGLNPDHVAALRSSKGTG